MNEARRPQSSASAAANDEALCWRTWPCASCRQRITPIGYLGERQKSGSTVRAGSIEKAVAEEIGWLLEWVNSCPHHSDVSVVLSKLTEGSEHLVYLDQTKGDVVKLTRPRIFGESYFLVDGIVNQKNCTPFEYLVVAQFEKPTQDYQNLLANIGMGDYISLGQAPGL